MLAPLAEARAYNRMKQYCASYTALKISCINDQKMKLGMFRFSQKGEESLSFPRSQMVVLARYFLFNVQDSEEESACLTETQKQILREGKTDGQGAIPDHCRWETASRLLTDWIQSVRRCLEDYQHKDYYKTNRGATGNAYPMPQYGMQQYTAYLLRAALAEGRLPETLPAVILDNKDLWETRVKQLQHYVLFTMYQRGILQQGKPIAAKDAELTEWYFFVMLWLAMHYESRKETDTLLYFERGQAEAMFGMSSNTKDKKSWAYLCKLFGTFLCVHPLPAKTPYVDYTGIQIQWDAIAAKALKSETLQEQLFGFPEGTDVLEVLAQCNAGYRMFGNKYYRIDTDVVRTVFFPILEFHCENAVIQGAKSQLCWYKLRSDTEAPERLLRNACAAVYRATKSNDKNTYKTKGGTCKISVGKDHILQYTARLHTLGKKLLAEASPDKWSLYTPEAYLLLTEEELEQEAAWMESPETLLNSRKKERSIL